MPSVERSKVVVLLLLLRCLLLPPLFCEFFYVWSLFSLALLRVVSSFVITSLNKRELVDLL